MLGLKLNHVSKRGPREQEGRSAHIGSGVDQGPAQIGQRADDNVWTELRLSLQMDLLLTNSRQSQVTFQGVGPSHGSAQVSRDEMGRQSHDHKAMSVVVECHGMVTSMVAGGQMDADFGQKGNWIGGGPAPFWSQREQPQPQVEAQLHPQPRWVLGAGVMNGMLLDLVDGVSVFLGTLMWMSSQQGWEVIEKDCHFDNSCIFKLLFCKQLLLFCDMDYCDIFTFWLLLDMCSFWQGSQGDFDISLHLPAIRVAILESSVLIFCIFITSRVIKHVIN